MTTRRSATSAASTNVQNMPGHPIGPEGDDGSLSMRRCIRQHAKRGGLHAVGSCDLQGRRDLVLGTRQHCDGDRLHRKRPARQDRKSTRLNSSHVEISYAVFCLKKKKTKTKYNNNTKKNRMKTKI